MMARIYLFIILVASLAPIAFAGESVRLAWDPNPEADVTGYRLRYGTASRSYSQTFDVGNTTTATVSNLTPGTRYYFAVSAYDSQSLESGLSSEISFTATANPPVAVIGSLSFRPNGSAEFQVGNFRSGLVAPGGIDVEASSDLVNWSVITRLSAPFQPVTLVDPEAAGARQRFYRLRPQ